MLYNLKIKRIKTPTDANWTAPSAGYSDIKGRVYDFSKAKEPEKKADGTIANPFTDNGGYWKANAELTGLINPFTNPITNAAVAETKIEVSFTDDHGWGQMVNSPDYFEYIAGGCIEKLKQRYKSLFGVQVDITYELVRDDPTKENTTSGTSGTNGTSGTSGTSGDKTINENPSGTSTSGTNGTSGTSGTSGASLVGDFTFNIEQENTFIGVNNEIGTLFIVGIGEIKEEPLDIPLEDELDEEYSEADFEGLEEKDMVFEVAEVTTVGADELEYATPATGNEAVTGSSNGNGMSAKEWAKTGTFVIGSKVPDNLSGPANYGLKVSLNKTMKNEYLPKIKKMTGYTNGIKLLAIVMAQKEGFEAGTRSYKTHNPGNIGNTDSGANNKLKTLEDGIRLQLDYISKVAKGQHTAYPLNKEKNMPPFYSKEIAKNNGPKGPYRGMTEYLPGYKFTYTGMIEQYVKIYATGARTGNSYISMIVSWYRQNGYSWVNGETTIAQLIEQNKTTGVLA